MEDTGNKGIMWLVGLVIIVLIIIFAYHSSGTPAETGPIKIGFIGPLSGDAASYGESMKNGAALAVDEINKAGGINGRQIAMIYEDGKCNGKDSASATQKLVNVDMVKYIVGAGCSGEVFSEIPITSAAKVFSISPVASASKLSGISPYFVRNNPSDSITGSVLADYLAKTYKTVAVISEQTDYAQGIKGNFIAEAEKGGLKVVDTEDFNSDVTDFRSELSKIKTANPDVIFINPQTPQNALRIADQAKQLGLKAQFAGAILGSDPSMITTKSTEGMIFSDLSGLSTAKGLDFIAKYKAVYNADSNYPFYSGSSYDAVYLLSQAITSAGYDTTKVAQYFHTLPSYVGTIGTYSFDQNGDMVGAGVVLQKMVNKKLINL